MSTTSTSRWMDYDTILDFWAEYSGGLVSRDEIHSEQIVLQDFSEPRAYPTARAAALDCFETIKVWAEDDDEAMAFVEDITQGEITAADIRG